MRVARIALLGAIAAAFPSIATGQQQPTASSEVSASGVSEIRLSPDHAVIFATVETRDRTAVNAASTNGTTTNAIVQSLHRAGLPASAVTTSDFSVDQYFPPRFDPREAQIPDGFITHTVVRAESDNIANVSSLIDAALAAGATRISVQFSASKLADTRRAAMETAFAAAKADAVALAQAAGGTLGRLLAVSPSAAPSAILRGISPMVGVVSGYSYSGSSTIIPPSITSSVTVSARWEFLSR